MDLMLRPRKAANASIPPAARQDRTAMTRIVMAASAENERLSGDL
jgi:hypothetical protein